jgi:hypothetical protein
MTDTPHLGLPLIEAAQAQKHVTHNEALTLLDLLVQLAVESRALTAPPSSPVDGARYIVKATATGAFAGKENQIAQFSDGGWLFYPPRTGWCAYVADESALVAYDGGAWISAGGGSGSGSITSLQNLTLLGIGDTADSTNPFAAKLNNALWTAKATGEGGDGTLRYKMSKESAAKTLSVLFQDNFSGRAEIGLTGDDDFHFKTSPDGTTWTDALLLDKSTGATKINTGFFLTGDISPAQITADQNDYNPAGFSTASVLRLSSDATRNLTGLSGGVDGRIVAVVNVGTNNIVLKDASSSSSTANRFAFGVDVTLAAEQSAVLWYDATDSRWKALSAPQASIGGGGGGGGSGSAPADLDLMLAELALGLADALNVAQFLGSAGNRFADSFDGLTYVDTGGATNLDTGTAGLLKPSKTGTTVTINGFNNDASQGAALTMVDRSTAVLNSVTISRIGAYSTVAATLTLKVVKRNSSSNFDIVYSQTVSHPGGSFVDFDLTTPYAVPATGTYYLAEYNPNGSMSNCPLTAMGQARAYKSGDITGSGQSGFTEDTGQAQPLRYTHTATTANLTVASTVLTAASAPSSVKLVARVREIDTITLNADLVLAVSRDGGTTYSNATMNDRFTANAIHVLESDALNISGQPSGTAMKWKATTANNKSLELHDVYLYWT